MLHGCTIKVEAVPMKRLSAVLVLFAASLSLYGQGTAPRMLSVTPDAGKPEAVFVATGENLSTDSVKEVFLTMDKLEIKVVIVSQKADAIEFKVPANVKPGRYGLMVLIADCTMYIEQPVKLTIQ